MQKDNIHFNKNLPHINNHQQDNLLQQIQAQKDFIDVKNINERFSKYIEFNKDLSQSFLKWFNKSILKYNSQQNLFLFIQSQFRSDSQLNKQQICEHFITIQVEQNIIQTHYQKNLYLNLKSIFYRKFTTFYPIPFQKLQHINFTNLQILILNSSNLINIQRIAFINAPNLKQLCLNYNCISSLGPFKKTSFRYLQMIDLKLNKFISKQLNHIQRMNSDCFQMLDLRLMYNIQALTQIKPLLKVKISNKQNLFKVLFSNKRKPNKIKMIRTDIRHKFLKLNQKEAQVIKQRIKYSKLE